MQFQLSMKLFFVLTLITVAVMSAFIGLRYYWVSDQRQLELHDRAVEVAQRVADSVKPSIWNIHISSFNRHYPSEVASVIIDAELASDFVTAINVYGNFGHLHLGREKNERGQLVDIKSPYNRAVNSPHEVHIHQAIREGTMTIGSVEVVYSRLSLKSALYSGLLLELAQVAVVSTLFVALLYWSLRQSLIRPVRSLQVARQTLDAITEGVVMTDGSFKVIEVNRAFTQLTGYSTLDLYGKRPQLKLAERSAGTTLWQQLRELKQWSGEVAVRRRGACSFPARLNFNEVWHDGNKVCHVGVITDISAQKASEIELERMAYFDALTALPNRTNFLKTLEHEIQLAQRHSRSLGLLYIDLDNFKWINDRHGHTVGDQYLESIAKRFKKRVRNTDFIFRLGGDEFTAIATDVCDEASLQHLAKDLIEMTNDILLLEGNRIHGGASIGIALYPRDAGNAESLIKRSDAAMYRAKELGRNQLVFFSADLESERKNTRELEEALRRGLIRDELVVYFQPKILYQTGTDTTGKVHSEAISSSRVQGAEVLLRWFRPGHSIVNPFDFIPVAEQSDLIVDIGYWVIRAACAQLARWQHTSLETISLAVNLSPRQLSHDDLVVRLCDTIAEFGVDPSLLELEITESAVIENVEQSVEVLNQLKQLGVTIAMDDFGTGFSSLSYLKRLPIDVLKIDRSFINDLPNDDDDAVIVNAIFSMARAMNIRVVAEGIENYAQLQFLLRQGCECSQGFFHSRPLPAADFERWVGLFKIRIEKALSESSAGQISGRYGISPALTGGS